MIKINLETDKFSSAMTVVEYSALEAARGSLRKSADRIARRLRSITPVKTGRMKRSIRVYPIRHGYDVGYSEARAWYAGIVNKVHRRAPFLERVLEEEIPGAVTRLNRSINQALGNIKRGKGGRFIAN